MQRSFNFANQSSIDSEENELPLINIVFLLLIFFLLAGSIAIPDLFVVQPPSSESELESSASEITLLIASDGKFAIQGEEVKFEQIQGIASKIVSENPHQPIKLKVDELVDSGTVIKAMEVLRDAGVKKTLLATTLKN